MTSPSSNEFARLLRDLQFGHLAHRTCTADAPMQHEKKDQFQWHHPDAVEEGAFFNLILCTCPHCKLSFTCLPREQ